MPGLTRHKSAWIYLLIGVAIMTVAALLELKMGRSLLCKCGTIRLWVGDTNSAENSQQLFDWYSFTHITHGFILYWVFHLISRGKWSLGLCLVLAIFLEGSWEVLENSPFIIDRYRQTMAQGYLGDTVLNSMSDISCAIAGFALAAWLPAWVTVALAVIMEAALGYLIRDNLTLNVIMLIHPFQGIRHWQLSKP
ncbi:MAG TPA: DUF2585 family protein [Tepidisphaeraceae bacterium]|jgi:hypothetical protein|nr:DUF2585 family protein [Tepidisphaeraceae bacterium]